MPGPPIVLPVAPSLHCTPSAAFGSAAVSAALTPIRFPFTTLFEAPLLSRTPFVAFPETMLPGPIVFPFAPETMIPLRTLDTGVAPIASVPTKLLTTVLPLPPEMIRIPELTLPETTLDGPIVCPVAPTPAISTPCPSLPIAPVPDALVPMKQFCTTTPVDRVVIFTPSPPFPETSVSP